MTTHTPTLDFDGAALAAAGCQGAAESEAVYRADLNAQYAEVVAERDALKAALRNILQPTPFGTAEHVDFNAAINAGRALLARLDGKETATTDETNPYLLSGAELERTEAARKEGK